MVIDNIINGSLTYLHLVGALLCVMLRDSIWMKCESVQVEVFRMSQCLSVMPSHSYPAKTGGVTTEDQHDD